MLKKTTLKVTFCNWGLKTIWHNISFPNFCSQKTLHPCTSCLAQNFLTLAVLYVTLTYRVQCTGHIRLLYRFCIKTTLLYRFCIKTTLFFSVAMSGTDGSLCRNNPSRTETILSQDVCKKLDKGGEMWDEGGGG